MEPEQKDPGSQAKEFGGFLQAREPAGIFSAFPSYLAFLIQRMPQFWEGNTENSPSFWLKNNNTKNSDYMPCLEMEAMLLRSSHWLLYHSKTPGVPKGTTTGPCTSLSLCSHLLQPRLFPFQLRVLFWMGWLWEWLPRAPVPQEDSWLKKNEVLPPPELSRGPEIQICIWNLIFKGKYRIRKFKVRENKNKNTSHVVWAN